MKMAHCELCGSLFDETKRVKGNSCETCDISFDNLCDDCICYCDEHEIEICCDCYAQNHNNCGNENPSYTKLREHIGHKIECVCYGIDGDYPENVSIECKDCNEVLVSEDRFIDEE